jgi:hypothetical protein
MNNKSHRITPFSENESRKKSCKHNDCWSCSSSGHRDSSGGSVYRFERFKIEGPDRHRDEDLSQHFIGSDNGNLRQYDLSLNNRGFYFLYFLG